MNTVLVYPQCPYCDVSMNIISKDRNDYICPDCFIPQPRPIRRPTKLIKPQLQKLGRTTEETVEDN